MSGLLRRPQLFPNCSKTNMDRHEVTQLVAECFMVNCRQYRLVSASPGASTVADQSTSAVISFLKKANRKIKVLLQQAMLEWRLCFYSVLSLELEKWEVSFSHSLARMDGFLPRTDI